MIGAYGIVELQVIVYGEQLAKLRGEGLLEANITPPRNGELFGLVLALVAPGQVGTSPDTPPLTATVAF